MNTLWNSAKLVTVLMVGVVGGAATETVVDHSTHVPLGIAVSVVMTAVGIAIAISRVLQKLQDSLDKLREKVEDLKIRMSTEEGRMDKEEKRK